MSKPPTRKTTDMSKKYEKIYSARNVASSDELPTQLRIEGGEIKTTGGCTPLFPSFTEGSVVTVVLRAEAVRMMDELAKLRQEVLGLRIEAAVDRSFDITTESAPEPSCALPKDFDEWCDCKQTTAPKFRAWTSEFRAWTPDEVPLGAQIRSKSGVGGRGVISAVTAAGEVVSPSFNPRHDLFRKHGFSLEAVRCLFEWRYGNFAEWKNCETEWQNRETEN